VGGRVLLLGMQGSGKGTVARHLVTALGAVHIGAGDLLRRHVKQGGPWAEEIDTRINREGRGVDERISYGLLERSLAATSSDQLLIIDGYPRLAGQIPLLLSILGRDPTLALLLELPRPIAVSRLLWRETCETCEAPFGPESPSLRDGACDRCGGVLERRDDDTPAKIGRRHDVWQTESSAILTFFDGLGLLETIDASRPVDQVTADAVRCVERALPK
jgi:adenylate kinase